MNNTLGEGRSREGGGSRAAQYDVITKTRDCPPVTNTIFERMLCSPAPDGLFECTESNNVNWRRGGGGNSPPTIPMSTTRTCPYVSKTPSPSVFVLDSCRVPSVFNNALASRDYSYIPGALCFYIYLDIRWQRLPLQNCNCITEIKKKKKNPRYGLSDTCTNSIGGETDGGVPVSDGGWRERERNTRTGETGGITIFFFFFYSRERFLA